MNTIEPRPVLQDRFLDHPYSLGGRVIDPVLGTLSWQGQVERIRRKELEVLALLASAGGAVVSRQAFIEVVWDGNNLVGDQAVTVAISALRQSLRDNQGSHPLIRTIPRRGYKLSEGVLQALPNNASTPVAESVPVSAPFQPGDTILGCPGWRLIRRLDQCIEGESTNHESWLAEPSEYSADVENTALRMFRFCRTQEYLRRLQREVTLLRYVNQSLAEHPGFALIRDWQLDEPPYYLARDYSKYGSLIEWAGAGGAAQAAPLALMAQLGESVAALHALGVVHRNLRADRILVDETDAGPQFKISALSLGVLLDRRKLAPLQITAIGLTLGTDDSTDQLSPAEDVAALGLIFLQWALGDWQAHPTENALAQVTDSALQNLLRCCVGPEDRRPTAAALAQQLRLLLTPKTVEATPGSPTIPAVPQTVPAPLIASALHTNALAAPESIGPYRLLGQLGEGGMGTVYLAEQRDPYRKVALKIIRSGLDGKQILSRFDAERQALAMMNHPNVASVLDSGLAADGRPFFAMEYIAGVEITKYCDAHHLSLPARIKLFLQVCDGVLHAHQKGVLHRDIKPSNLMVSNAPENAGAAKVIDFGLAKSLHGKLASQTLHTHFGAFIGTPVYSSPEHILGAASGVDTRSDIFSLGVVLYELLAGMTPIADESLKNLEPVKVRELVRKLRLPSMREQLQNSSTEKRKQLAELRATKVDELPKTLEGDLSWVVGKCLERDPNDRYASVLALREDLQRWLALRPVEARPTTGWYRFRKYVRRNRLLVGSAAVVALALLATTTAAVVGFIRAERALEASRSAEAEATAAADFQVKQMDSIDLAGMGLGLRSALIEAANKYGVERGWDAASLAQHQRKVEESLQGINFTDLSRAQLDNYSLEPALASIKNDFAAHPVLQARLLETIAETLRKLGQYETALEAIELALTRRRAQLGDAAPLTLHTLMLRSKIFEHLTRFEKAAADAQESLDGARRTLGRDAPQTWRAQGQLAQIKFRQGKLVEALTLAHEALAGMRRTLGDGHRDTLEVMRQLIRYQREAGQSQDALAVGEAALTSSRRNLGEDDSLTVRVMEDLAGVYWVQRRYADAETLMRRVMEVRTRKLGDMHPESWSGIKSLTTVLLGQGKYAESEVLRRRLYESAAQTLGVEHLDTIEYRRDLGVALLRLGRFAEAETLLREALVSQRRVQGEEHNGVAVTKLALAQALQNQEKLAEATEAATGALKIYHRNGNVYAPNPVETQKVIGSILQDRGRYREAELYLRGAFDRLKEKLGPDDILVADFSRTLADTLAAQNKVPEAITLYQNAMRVYHTTLGKNDRQSLRVSSGLAELQGTIKVSDELIAMQQASLQALVKNSGESHPDVLWTSLVVAKLLFMHNQLQPAQSVLELSLPKVRASFGDQHRYTLRTLDLLGQVLHKRGELAESLVLAEEIAKSSQKFAESPHLLGSFQTHHAQTLLALGRFAEAERVLAGAKKNLAQADGAPKQDLDALISAHIALYTQWQSVAASEKSRTQLGLWQRRRELMNSGADSLTVLSMN